MTDLSTAHAGELRACPKCGGSAKLHQSRDGDAEWVRCSFCGHHGGIRLTAGEAIAAWNTRPAAPDVARLEERVAALEAALRECADDLEAEVRDRYHGHTFPAAQAKFDADMQPVTTARALLSGGEG